MDDRVSGIGGTLPETFQERGMSVPFTTKVLMYARLRVKPGEGLEALLPGLSGARGTYVIPWNSLHEVVSMSLHDRTLYKLVSELSYHGPDQIREAILEVQKSGYDGPDSADLAAQANQLSYETALMTNFTLVTEAVRQVGGGKEITPTDLIDEQNMRQARDDLRSYAKTLGLDVQGFMDILTEWSEIISAIGSPGGEYKGYLMSCIMGMARLSAELQDWAGEEPPENMILVQQINDASAMAGRIAFEEIQNLQKQATSMSVVLADWAKSKEVLRFSVSRIASILDGWSRIITLWDKVKDGMRYQQREMVTEVVQHLPLLPMEILNDNQKIIWQKITLQQNRLIEDTAEMTDMVGEDNDIEDAVADLEEYIVES